MRLLLIAALTAIASYFALMVMPWWVPMPIACCLILLLPMHRNWQAFLATGLGAALCYTVITLLTDQANEHILSRKMAILFHLPSYPFMIVVTALTGFITAGLGGWAGSALRRLFQRKNSGNEAAAGGPIKI
jgi:CDP-diglyceride synthetase